MQLKNDNIDELIAKYLAGEALPEEAIALDEWIAQSPTNATYYNQSKKAFGYALDNTINTQKVWNNIIRQQKSGVVQLAWYVRPWQIAATFVLLSTIGFITYFMLRTVPTGLVVSSSASTIQKQLSDGSKVTLNKQTQLTIAGDFNEKTRKLTLQGEAFFEVKHNDEKPFVIDAAGVLIKDIGTAFNVKALPQNDSVWVQVTEGIVEMQTKTESITLQAGQYGIYLRPTQQLIRGKINQTNIASYKTKSFVFKAQTLQQVITEINAVYKDALALENTQLNNCTITVSFTNESPEAMAVIIAETLGLTIEKKNETYLLKGSVCAP